MAETVMHLHKHYETPTVELAFSDKESTIYLEMQTVMSVHEISD
jgi:hypothetical protein